MICDAATSQTQLECPICKSTTFVAFNGRANARCGKCQSMERTRLLWMVLEKFNLFQTGQRILHLAPEIALTMRFVELSGDRYHACDIDASRYNSRYTTVRPLDLCVDLVKLPSRSFDLIIHTHVLEHIVCDVEGALVEMERILAPGGHHFFSVPIRGDITREDLSDDLTPAHRTLMFGQEDHYRIFGVKSLTEMLARVWGDGDDPLITPRDLFSEDALRKAVIPEVAWSGYSSHSLFHHVRPVRSRPRAAQSRSLAESRRPKNISNPAPAAPRVLLHIGMPGDHCPPIHRWLNEQEAALSASGVDQWRRGDRARLLFMACASEKRIAAGDLPFSRTLPPNQPPPTPQEGDQAFKAFIDSLAGRIGIVSAETLWSLTRDEVQSLHNRLSQWGVVAHILCFVYQPETYLSMLIGKRSGETLTLQAFGPAATRNFAFSYSRLAAWADIFGDAQVSVRDAAKDPTAQFADVLVSIGAAPIAAGADGAASRRQRDMSAVKALVAMNEWRRKSGAAHRPLAALLQAALAETGSDEFALPESLAMRLDALLKREEELLSGRFGLSLTEKPLDRIDDHAFLNWSGEEVGRLLVAINALLLAREAKEGDQPSR